MSYVAKLIEQLAPNRVQFKTLGETGEFIRGNGLQKADLTEKGAPAIHYGQIHTHYGIWTESTKSFTNPTLAARLRRAKPGDLIIATTSEDDKAVAKATAWLGSEEVAVSGDAYIYRHSLDPRYVAYFFNSERFQEQKKRYVTGTKVRRVSGDSLAKIRIPVPPSEVQREIVRVLDQFAQMEANLEADLVAEIETRRRQYVHYRTRLLDDASRGAEHIELGEVGRIVTGRTPKASDVAAWGDAFDFVTPTDIKNGMKVVSAPARRLSEAGADRMSKALVPAGSLLVTCIGADMGKTVINANQCVTNQQINAIVPTVDIDVDFLFHVLTSMRDRIRAQGERGGGTMPIINKSDFSRIQVSVPALGTQKSVAAKLDKFDSLMNDLSIDLAAELTARRKQYEYYRDKLLTFEESVA